MSAVVMNVWMIECGGVEGGEQDYHSGRYAHLILCQPGAVGTEKLSYVCAYTN